MQVSEVVNQLTGMGYCVVRAHRTDDVSAVRASVGELLATTTFGANSFVGTSTKRVHSVFGRTDVLDGWATDPLVIETAKQMLGDVLLSASVLCEIHPGESAQAAHTDDGVYPLPTDHREVMLSALWAIDDFAADNGATVVFPRSHGQRMSAPDPANAVTVEMPAGSVLLYTGTLWHGGGANTTTRPRLGLILTYAESWLRPQDAHLISVPVEEARRRSPQLRALLGYSLRPPFMGYVDGRDPAELFIDDGGSR